MDALIVDYGHDGAVIGGMGIAMVGRIVKIGIASLGARMVGQDLSRNDVRPDHDMKRQALGGD